MGPQAMPHLVRCVQLELTIMPIHKSAAQGVMQESIIHHLEHWLAYLVLLALSPPFLPPLLVLFVLLVLLVMTLVYQLVYRVKLAFSRIRVASPPVYHVHLAASTATLIKQNACFALQDLSLIALLPYLVASV